MAPERDGNEGDTGIRCSRRRLVFGFPAPLAVGSLLATGSSAKESSESSPRADARPDEAYARRYYDLCRR